MADRYYFSTVAGGVSVTGGTDITLLDFTTPADRRARIVGVEISSKDTDATLAAQLFRLAVTTVTGTGATAATETKVDAGAPASGLTPTYGRIGYTEGALLRPLQQLAPQGVAYVRIFEDPIEVAISTRAALICDSAVTLGALQATLIVDV